MIISRIIQNGLDLSIETNDIPYQRSANHKIQFVKDPNYSNYSLQAYGKLPKTGYQESEEFKLELEDGNYIKLPSAVFATKGIFQIAISLTGVNGDIINLGIVSYKIRKSFGDSTNILPDNEKAWNSFVHLEVDNYFNNTYQSKLDDFNTKYDDTVTKYNEIVETSTEVKKEYDEVASMKKSVDSSKQSIDNTKKQIDSTYDEYKKFANDTKTEINNAKQAIINGKNEINTLAKEKVDEYTQKVTDFNNNYNTKTASLDTKINEIQTNANEIVETSTEQLKENIAESKNDAIKQIQSEGQSYQDQINKLQKSEALQDEVLDKLNEEVDLKLTQPYLNNNDSTHITSSDNGSLKNIVVKGNTVQNSTKGYQLLNIPEHTQVSNGITTIIKDGLISCKGTITEPGWFNVSPIFNIIIKKDITYTFSINKTLNYNCSLKLLYEDTDSEDYKITAGKTSVQFTPKKDTTGVYVWIEQPTGTNIDIQFRIQLEKGSTAHDYEPYTCGQPSPNPDYPQEIKAVSNLSALTVGKNLCGGYDFSKSAYGIDVVVKNSTININGTPAGNYPTVILYPNGDVVLQQWWLDSDSLRKKNIYKNKGFYAHDLKEKTLQIDFDGTFDVNGGELFYVVVGYETYGEYKTFLSKSTILFNLSTKERINYIAIGFTGTAKISNFNVKIQLKYDKNKSDFIPYQSQSFNYTLSKPLYRLSDSVYDYIDLNRGKIVRNIGVITFDGSDDEDIRLSPPDGSRHVYLYTFRNSILSIENINPYCKSNMFKFTNLWTDGIMSHNHLFYVSSTNIYVSYNEITSLNDFKTWLNQNPITVVYQLATPTEEPLPPDLQSLLQSLKSYYPQTNIIWDTEVKPYINFDYKLNLKSWIEDKDNEAIIYDKQNKEKDKYSSTFFENMFALQRTGEIYTVKFPKWETSHISTGEKLDANAGLVCEPSTKTIKGQNDYANIPLFKTYDVNAYVDDEGVRHVTAIKGDKDFKDEGKVDVFVLGMSYYEKVWEDEQYWYYSRTDSPRDGYTVARECINRDGSIQPFALYAKYVSGFIDKVPYSSKGLIPGRVYSSTPLPSEDSFSANNSYNNMITNYHKKGNFYCGGMTCDYKYILSTFYLKYATLNTQSIMYGCANCNFQYKAAIQSEDKNTYFPVTKSQATQIEIGSSVSVGYQSKFSSTITVDRSYSNTHRYADDAKVLKKEDIDDNNVAIYLNITEPFNTMPVTIADGVESEIYISSMHWQSGFSDDVLDRDGCPCETKAQLVNGKFPMVIQGIEIMVGGYETYANAFMDIVDSTGKREVYVQNDASQLTTNVTTAKASYKKSQYAIQPSKVNSWNYITRIDFDLENGAFVQTNVGQDGSSTTTGFADGVYVDNASSGQKEFLGFGTLWLGSGAGLSCLSASVGVGGAYWHVLARLSINGVGGELTA